MNLIAQNVICLGAKIRVVKRFFRMDETFINKIGLMLLL